MCMKLKAFVDKPARPKGTKGLVGGKYLTKGDGYQPRSHTRYPEGRWKVFAILEVSSVGTVMYTWKMGAGIHGPDLVIN